MVLGRHSDDEMDLGFERCIVSLSLAPENTSRTLRFYRRRGPTQKLGSKKAEVELKPGDALIMIGFGIQEKFTHELVKDVSYN